MTDTHPHFGPAAPFSEHRRGDGIVYLRGGAAHAGRILWVAAAIQQEGRPFLSMYYIVVAHTAHHQMHLVKPAEVIVTKNLPFSFHS